MFAIIILALLPRALAQTKVITGIDCQIDSRNKDLLSETWDRTKFGEGGVNDDAVRNGDEGKLFQFDCQKRCYDSDNDMGKFWMTCGYTWKHIKDLLPEDEIVEDVRTEAYDNEGSCREEGWKKAMNLDATGYNAVDTAGQDGHYGFFLCYKTGLWKESFKKSIEYISDLQARTEDHSSTKTTPPKADALPNKKKDSDGWELIGQWDTHNNGENFAYGDQKRTGGWMYLYTKKKWYSRTMLVGSWKSKLINLKPNEEKIIEASELSITEASGWNQEIKTHWESKISSSHTVSTALSASGTYKGVDVGVDLAYDYSKQYEETSTRDTAIRDFAKESLTMDSSVTKSYTIPAADEYTAYMFYYFVVEAISKDRLGNDVVTVFGGTEINAVYRKRKCGRELPPNCFPQKYCDPADDTCWKCTDTKHEINPDFRIPHYCEEGKGCDWVPINTNECPPKIYLEEKTTYEQCGPKNYHGQICEAGLGDELINGQNSDIKNCYGKFDIFRFDCRSMCPIASQNGRCGPLFNHQTCSTNYNGNAKYCDERNGQCVDTPAQQSEKYDDSQWEGPEGDWKFCRPGKDCPTTSQDGLCGPLYNRQICSTHYDSKALYCNEDNGKCGNTAAHRDAQESTEYDDSQLVGACRPSTVPPEGDWIRLRINVECGNNEKEVHLGTFDSVGACAAACREREECTNFIYGKGSKAGKCWDEGVTESTCTTWEDDLFDFYGFKATGHIEVTMNAKLNTYSVLYASEDLAFYVLAFIGLVAVLNFVRSALRKDEYKAVTDETSKLEELNEEI